MFIYNTSDFISPIKKKMVKHLTRMKKKTLRNILHHTITDELYNYVILCAIMRSYSER